MSREVQVRALGGDELAGALEDVARLRIAVFRDWPYLYDGSLDYERRYLAHYRTSADAVLAGAFVDGELVGAATGTPMEDHAADFAAPLSASGLSVSDIFYCAESVLLPDFRGLGIGHRFFDIREAHARELGRRYVVFCGVVRPDDHPLKPPSYRSLDSFWRGRGYEKLDGAVAEFSWRDIGENADSRKPLQVWIKELR